MTPFVSPTPLSQRLHERGVGLPQAKSLDEGAAGQVWKGAVSKWRWNHISIRTGTREEAELFESKVLLWFLVVGFCSRFFWLEVWG
jgi:hypothetical protein